MTIKVRDQDHLFELLESPGAPWVLDLFCCAGGAARGYQLAGFRVLGVDNVDRPEYCGEAFHLGDAVLFATLYAALFFAVHASPPCQKHSTLTKGNRGRKRAVPSAHTHVDLIPQTREALELSGRPYVIENVGSAPVRPDVVLCGLMFGLKVFRHRTFELGGGWTAKAPAHRPHKGHRVAGWRHGVNHPGDMVAVYGDGGGKGSLADWQGAMGIDWITDKPTLAEAIPPAFTNYLGCALIGWPALTDKER